MIAEGKPMTKTQESMLLLRHGTPACDLSASAIAQTAVNDMRVKLENARRREARRKAKAEHVPTKFCDPQLPYAFQPTHVGAAKTAADLLRLAIENESCKTPDTVNRLRIYGNRERLEAALALLASA